MVFQGADAEYYGTSFIETRFKRQAGSDEVGTGDYFGPVVVVASIVEESDEELINKYHINDSKQMNDEDILKCAPLLREKIKHSLLILEPEQYNRVHETNNLNMIKAKMHNQAYLNLKARGYKIPSAAYVDQFCDPNLYYKYLVQEKEVYHELIFETKAESKYPAVAVSSVIARYVFLKKIEEMEKKYGMSFHKGAGTDVDICARDFVKRYSKKELGKVAKLHFKNTENI
ncbi:MAG: ribonuclease HIII [Solobacterium sp.]|nr:ribonuclease HIII [Solobacterium sp.]